MKVSIFLDLNDNREQLWHSFQPEFQLQQIVERIRIEKIER